MSPWGIAVKRPVLTTMATLIIVVFGTVSLLNLPIDLMPDITFPSLSVSASYANAAPEEMEELVTRRIEEILASVSGVEELNSTSSVGSSNVRVSFTWGTNLDEAATDIRDRLDRIIARLPDDASRPMLRKFDISAMPIMLLGARSDLDPAQVRNIIEEQVKYRFERVPGVASIDVMGGLQREIQVELDPVKVSALGLSMDGVINSIRASNMDTPAGTITRGRTELSVRARGVFTGIDDLAGTIVAVRDGAAIRLDDIAEIRDSWQDITRLVRIDGQPGLQLSISKQADTNTVEVARGVLRELERVNRDIPQIDIAPIFNTADYIESSISNVTRAAIAGGFLAVIILLFFLHDVRSTIIVTTAIPVSIIATFALIYFAGFTLNIMTLGGLALGIGMLVDNAIVVLENIYRIKKTGKSPQESAVTGCAEVAAAITASTLTTMVVFLPMLFIEGIAGIMFQQLAYIVAFSLFCSLLVALTVVPMMAARMIKNGQNSRIADRLEKSFKNLEASYFSLLKTALCHRFTTIFIALTLLGLSFALLPMIGTELMPETDEGELRVNLEMEAGVSLDVMNEQSLRVEAAVREAVPEIDRMIAQVGGTAFGRGHSGSNRSMLRISLLPLEQRSRSSNEIASSLRRMITGIPGVTVRVRASSGMPMMRMGGRGGERLQVEIRGHDMEVADQLAARIQQTVESVSGVTDASLSRESAIPEEIIRVNRERAADLGLTVSRINSALRTALSGSIAGYYREGGDEFSIRVRLADAKSMTPDDIRDITVTNTSGQPIALRNVITIGTGTGPMQIARKNQERIVTVSAEISGRDMGSVVTDLREKLHAIPVPQGFQILIAGDHEEQQEAFSELFMSLLLALLLVYMVMAGLYESLRDPFIVMFSVPLAIIGVIWLLFITNTTFNIQSLIGMIMLGGIVVNNAILLVDYTNLLRIRDGMPLFDAISEAGRRRLRPILMTTLTTVLGLLPLALGLGEGGEAQAPMARAVIGGLISSTLITLVFIPVIYSFFSKGEHECVCPD